MFDPYQHDPMVSRSELSVDKFQIILPLSLVVNAVILDEYKQLNSDSNESLIFVPDKTSVDKDGDTTKDVQKDTEEKENESENDQTPKKGIFY